MSEIRKFLQGSGDTEKRKANVILRNDSRNMSIECKTLFVSVWDAVMKLTAVVKYHFSSDILLNSDMSHPSLDHRGALRTR